MFKPSSLFISPLVAVPSAPGTIAITVTSMVHSFFQFSYKVQVRIFLLSFPQFNPGVRVHYSEGALFLVTLTRSGRLAEIKWSVCILKSPRTFGILLLLLLLLLLLMMMKNKYSELFFFISIFFYAIQI